MRRAHAEPTRSRLARWRQSAEGGVHDGGKRRRLPSLASLTVLPRGRHAVRLPPFQDPLACSNVVILPLVTTGVAWPASRSARRIAAARGTWRPPGPRASERTVGIHS